MDFKGKAKAFTRTYSFLAAILPYTNAEWEKLSIFLNFLMPKLPAPVEEDLAKGILEAIDMDSYRAERQAAIRIALPDEDAEIGPVPTSGGAHKAEPELDRLSNILAVVQRSVRQRGLAGHRPRAPDDHRGNPAEGRRGLRVQNARAHSDRQNARIEHDKALWRRDRESDAG